MNQLTRGRVYLVDLGPDVGPKPFLVITNNRRNAAFGDALGIRLTTSGKPTMPSIVELSAADAPLVGRVLCDAYTVLYPDEVLKDSGALSPPTLRKVEAGLKHSLLIP